MKKLLLSLVLAAFAGNLLFAQAPQTIKDKFTSKYPTATNAYWKTDKDKDTYKVSYTDMNTQHALVYDKNGNVLKEELQVTGTSIPASIADYYKTRTSGDKDYAPNYTVWKVTDKDGKTWYYSDYKGKFAYFDKEGKVTTKGMATGDSKPDKDDSDMPKDDKMPIEK